jgi:hypothetical protein
LEDPDDQVCNCSAKLLPLPCTADDPTQSVLTANSAVLFSAGVRNMPVNSPTSQFGFLLSTPSPQVSITTFPGELALPDSPDILVLRGSLNVAQKTVWSAAMTLLEKMHSGKDSEMIELRNLRALLSLVEKPP